MAMKKLSDYQGAEGIEKAADVLSVVMDMLAKPANAAAQDEKRPVKLFSRFMKNSPEDMLKIFAILSDADPAEYTCNGAEAMTNMLLLAADPIFVGLFISQGPREAVKPSGSASENSEAN